MLGPYQLNYKTINSKIDKVVPGGYLLGRMVRWGTTYLFIPKYVGRSHGHLNERLKDHNGFTHFKYRIAPSPREAFRIECRYYHRYMSSLINKSHPRPPKEANWKCPRCAVEG